MPNKTQTAEDGHRLPEAEKKLLRLPEVLGCTGLSRSGLYQMIKAEDFPSQVPLGTRAVAWDSAEVQAWIADRISRARPAQRTVVANGIQA
jgi:prophage regulatory protein